MTTQDLRVAAVIDGHLLGYDRWPALLDAPLSWAAWRDDITHGRPPAPLTATYAHDFPLPLDRWEQSGTWGWCTSRPVVDVLGQTAVQVRRKPAIEAMAQYGKERKHHAALGPTKARDTTISAQLVGTVTWQARVTDRDELERLLRMITHLGGRHRNGYGTVREWRLDPGTPDGWRDRPMPSPGGRPQGVRAPYWHPARRVPCTH